MLKGWLSFGSVRGVCFFSLALTSRLPSDGFFFRAMRGGSGYSSFSSDVGVVGKDQGGRALALFRFLFVFVDDFMSVFIAYPSE